MDDFKNTNDPQNDLPEVISNLTGGAESSDTQAAAQADTQTDTQDNVIGTAENVSESINETKDIFDNASKNTESEPPSPDGGKKSAKPAIIVFAVLAVIAVGITAFVYMNNPERVVKSALRKTAEVIEKRPYIFNEISPEKCDFLDGTSCSASAAVTINEYSPSPELNGIGAGMSIDFDAEAAEAAGTVSASYNGADLISADLYTDNDIIMAAVPALFSQVFQFDTENVFSQLKNSGFYPAELDDSGINDFSLKLFGYDNEIAENADIMQMRALAEKISESVKNNTAGFDGLTYSKYDDKSIEINGSSKICKGYAVTVDGEKAADVFFDILRDTAAADEFKELIKPYLVLDYSNSDVLQQNYAGPVEYCEAVLDSLDESIDYMSQSVGINDVDIYAYINNGYIVDTVISTAAKYTMLGLPLFTIDIDTSFCGTQNITDSINAKITLSNGEDTNIYEINENASADGDVIDNGISLKAVYNDETLYDIDLSSNYNKSNNDFNAVLTADAEYSDTITLTADGSIISDADKWAVSLDTLSLEQSESRADIALDFEISALKNAIEKPEGEVLEIFGKDSEEAKEIISSARDELYSIAAKILVN